MRAYVEEVYTLRAIETCVATGILFSALSAGGKRGSATQFLIRCGEIELRRLEAGQIIVSEGDRASHFYIVRYGNLRVFQTIDGRERSIRTLGEHDYFGELAILNKGLRTASVAALDPAEVVLIPAEVLLELCEQYLRLEVVIEDHCIGCGLCERNCPYGSIHMVGRDAPNLAAADFLGGNPSLIAAGPSHAVNCDLCNGGKPHCVQACPHDAAFRLDGPEMLKKMSDRLNSV